MVTSSVTREALRLFGLSVREARIERRMTLQELAERVGVSVPTVRRVEAGDPGVAIGTAFEVAAVLGIPLYTSDESARWREAQRLADRLALLPASVRQRQVDDDF